MLLSLIIETNVYTFNPKSLELIPIHRLCTVPVLRFTFKQTETSGTEKSIFFSFKSLSYHDGQNSRTRGWVRQYTFPSKYDMTKQGSRIFSRSPPLLNILRSHEQTMTHLVTTTPSHLFSKTILGDYIPQSGSPFSVIWVLWFRRIHRVLGPVSTSPSLCLFFGLSVFIWVSVVSLRPLPFEVPIDVLHTT